MYVIMDNEKIEFYRDKYFTFGEHEAFRHAGDVCVVNSVLGHAEPSVSFVLRRTVLTMF